MALGPWKCKVYLHETTFLSLGTLTFHTKRTLNKDYPRLPDETGIRMIATWTCNVLCGLVISDFKMKTLSCLTLQVFLESWDSVSCNGVRQSHTEEPETILVDSTHSILPGTGVDPMMLGHRTKWCQHAGGQQTLGTWRAPPWVCSLILSPSVLFPWRASITSACREGKGLWHNRTPRPSLRQATNFAQTKSISFLWSPWPNTTLLP